LSVMADWSLAVQSPLRDFVHPSLATSLGPNIRRQSISDIIDRVSLNGDNLDRETGNKDKPDLARLALD
jgi:hypothetical protein